MTLIIECLRDMNIQVFPAQEARLFQLHTI